MKDFGEVQALIPEASMARKENTKIQKILFPTDFSGASIHAAAYALLMARTYKATLYVLHVVDTSEEASGFYLPHLSYEKLDRELLESASGMLDKFCSTRFKGYRNIEKRVLSGEPYKEILKVIKGADIDMVVMGTFGKARIDRFFFGSTTERVMRKASCPVFVVPPPR